MSVQYVVAGLMVVVGALFWWFVRRTEKVGANGENAGDKRRKLDGANRKRVRPQDGFVLAPTATTSKGRTQTVEIERTSPSAVRGTVVTHEKRKSANGPTTPEDLVEPAAPTRSDSATHAVHRSEMEPIAGVKRGEVATSSRTKAPMVKRLDLASPAVKYSSAADKEKHKRVHSPRKGGGRQFFDSASWVMDGVLESPHDGYSPRRRGGEGNSKSGETPGAISKDKKPPVSESSLRWDQQPPKPPSLRVKENGAQRGALPTMWTQSTPHSDVKEHDSTPTVGPPRLVVRTNSAVNSNSRFDDSPMDHREESPPSPPSLRMSRPTTADQGTDARPGRPQSVGRPKVDQKGAKRDQGNGKASTLSRSSVSARLSMFESKASKDISGRPDSGLSGSTIRGKKKFQVQTEKCEECGKSVYATERLAADGKTYHKTCMRCTHCDKVLGLGNYASLEGKLYCKPHFKQLFKLKGNYASGFGVKTPKERWEDAKGDSQ